MLSYLSIKNLAVIKEATIEFDKGLNIISGETGAGKSIFIGAIKLLLGDRFNKNIVRDEKENLYVDCLFTGIDNSNIPDTLRQIFNIDDEVIIRREVDTTGRNRISINSQIGTVGDLKQLGVYLADIHGQHEHQALLSSRTHIQFIDSLVDKKILQSFQSAYQEYKFEKNKLVSLKDSLRELEVKKDLYSFQLEELKSLSLDIDVDSKLEDKINYYSNMEKIQKSCSDALNLLDNNSARSMISDSIGKISSIIDSHGNVGKAIESLESAEETVRDAIVYIENITDGEAINENEINRLSERVYKISSLIKKYGVNEIEDLVSLQESLEEKLYSLESGADGLYSLEASVERLFSVAKEKATALNTKRMEIAPIISRKVEEGLSDVALKDSRFEVKFYKQDKVDYYDYNRNEDNSYELDELGGMRAEFYISLNSGFAMAPLTKVASGGEISRVMLVLKSIFAHSHMVNSMVFDEIDTGISGITAKKVAEKLLKISENRQIIVITHLPVVAGYGNKHFVVEKNQEDTSGMVSTKISEVKDIERKNTIATMISGEITASSLGQASELLREGKN